MSLFNFRLTSVTRWLLVVVGCVRLASAQPMSAAEPSPAPRSEQTIIYPKGTAPTAAPTEETGPVSAGNPWWAVSGALLAIAGGWVLYQRRRGMAPLGRAARKLAVEESKSLGNRQYLVVASYEGRRFLLGVTPERIQLISDLREDSPDIRA